MGIINFHFFQHKKLFFEASEIRDAVRATTTRGRIKLRVPRACVRWIDRS